MPPSISEAEESASIIELPIVIMPGEAFNNSNARPELSQVSRSSTSHWPATFPGSVTHLFIWQYFVLFLLGLVLYDQGKTGYQVLGSDIELISPPVIYLKRKGSIAGPRFKIPLVGPFIQALHPKFEAYLAQWASGPLSCVSVFHKYVL